MANRPHGEWSSLRLASQGTNPDIPERLPALEELVNVNEFENICKRKIPSDAFDYIVGGADDEWTVRRNRQRFERITFRPRVLVDVSHLDVSTTLFGQQVEMPILVAPTGSQQRVHPEGELATARAAGAAKAIMVVSASSSYNAKDIAVAATGPLWFQFFADGNGFRENVETAVSLGCKAICLTVDSPYFPNRERETRSRLVQPASKESPRSRAAPTRYGLPSRPTARLTWSFVEELNSYATVPVLLKGILTPEAAMLCVEHGASGIIVSNHGGRYLDGTPSTIEVLPDIVDAVAGRIPVLVDGGFRRGTDILKALAIGAKGVLVGRPPLWGLGAFGQAGVERVLQLLQTELALAMGMCGCPNLAAINRNIVAIERPVVLDAAAW